MTFPARSEQNGPDSAEKSRLRQNLLLGATYTVLGTAYLMFGILKPYSPLAAFWYGLSPAWFILAGVRFYRVYHPSSLDGPQGLSILRPPRK
jgi:hypothetical protein